MLSHLKLLVSSLLVVTIASSLFAKEMPITQEVELSIPLGEFSVIEFPFKITSKNITSFLPIKKIITKVKKVGKEKVNLDDDLVRKPIPKKVKKVDSSKLKKTINQRKKSKYISITQNINSLTFFTRKEGIIKMVIWGYDHPILLTLRVSRKDGFGLYKFILPQSKNKDAIDMEQSSHEKVINKLMVHLFNQTLPNGYKSISKDINFISNGFAMRLNRKLIGKRYTAEEWILTNHTDVDSEIHEESFYQSGVYGVSLEVDSLKQEESTRVFIVRVASSER